MAIDHRITAMAIRPTPATTHHTATTHPTATTGGLILALASTAATSGSLNCGYYAGWRHYMKYQFANAEHTLVRCLDDGSTFELPRHTNPANINGHAAERWRAAGCPTPSPYEARVRAWAPLRSFGGRRFHRDDGTSSSQPVRKAVRRWAEAGLPRRRGRRGEAFMKKAWRTMLARNHETPDRT